MKARVYVTMKTTVLDPQGQTIRRALTSLGHQSVNRDLALQNVRYVLDAAGRLHEDFQPRPGGFIQARAHQVLDETVALLERIVAEPGRAPLLAAIGDGTFGLMKRPADKGKGYDGVTAHAPGYYNPATEVFEGRP